MKAVACTDEGTRVPCSIDNLTVEGVRLSVYAAGAAPLPVGARVQLELTDTNTSAQTRLACEVVYRDEQAIGRTYGLKFLNRDQVRHLLTPALARIFNRRQSFRVPTVARNAIDVTIQPPREAVMELIVAPMLDLSTSGCALRVDLAQERQLASFTQVDLLFMLPGASIPCAMGAEIRSRESEGTHVRYGIGFQETRDAEYARNLDQIIKFVMRVQQELL